jgi:hypothetical protein
MEQQMEPFDDQLPKLSSNDVTQSVASDLSGEPSNSIAEQGEMAALGQGLEKPVVDDDLSLQDALGSARGDELTATEGLSHHSDNDAYLLRAESETQPREQSNVVDELASLPLARASVSEGDSSVGQTIESSTVAVNIDSPTAEAPSYLEQTEPESDNEPIESAGPAATLDTEIFLESHDQENEHLEESDVDSFVDQLIDALQGGLSQDVVSELISDLQGLHREQVTSLFARANITIAGNGNIVGNNNAILYMESAEAPQVATALAAALKDLWQQTNEYEASGLTKAALVIQELSVKAPERDRIHRVFAPPDGYLLAQEILRQKGMLWIKGAAGLWKRNLALWLALQEDGHEIYEIPRRMNWSELGSVDIHDSILVLPDTLGAIRFERETFNVEFDCLKGLLQRNNKIIATSPNDIFAEARRATSLGDEVTTDDVMDLNEDSYAYAAKLSILENLVQFYYENGAVTEDQHQWAMHLLSDSKKTKTHTEEQEIARQKLRLLLSKKWLPIDIERFIREGLREASSEDELHRYLERDADIDTRVHTWFLQLDEATRSFILTLTIFAGFETNEVWTRHCEIVAALRSLNPMIPILPVGILRQHALPYVTSEGSLDFVNPRAYQAVAREVARNYREYFIELKRDHLKKWSIPEKLDASPKEKQDELIADSEDIRQAVAQMVGEVGKYGIDDIADLLNDWAVSSRREIAKTAGVALRQMAIDPVSGQEALRFLHEWSLDYSSPEAKHYRWTCAAALWRLVDIDSRPDLLAFVVRHLRRLAADRDDYVVNSTATAVNRIVANVPFEDVVPILTILAGNSNRKVQKETLFALEKALSRSRIHVHRLLRQWTVSHRVKVRRTAIHALLACDEVGRTERYSQLLNILSADPVFFVGALQWILEGEPSDLYTVMAVLETLATPVPSTFREEFVAALAEAYRAEARATQHLLSTLWRTKYANLRTVPAAVQAQVPAAAAFTLLLDRDVEFEERCTRLIELMRTDALAFSDALWRAHTDGADATAARPVLRALAQSAPDGPRSQFIMALATAYEAQPHLTQQLLSILYAIAETSIHGLPADVYASVPRVAVHTLLTEESVLTDERTDCLTQLAATEPEAFVTVLHHVLMIEQEQAISLFALNKVAENSLAGSRQALVTALAGTYLAEPVVMQDLLSFMFHTDFPSVQNLPSEVDTQHPIEALRNLLIVHIDTPLQERSARLNVLLGKVPQEFVNTAREALIVENEDDAVLPVLELLADDPPAGNRPRIVNALADAYRSDPVSTQELLSHLWQTAGLATRRLPYGVDASHPELAIHQLLIVHVSTSDSERFMRLNALLHAQPSIFVNVLHAVFVGERADDLAAPILELLANQPPKGSRPQLVDALANSYLAEPTRLQELLSSLFHGAPPVIQSLPLDVDARHPEIATCNLLTVHSQLPWHEKYARLKALARTNTKSFLIGCWGATKIALHL